MVGGESARTRVSETKGLGECLDESEQSEGVGGECAREGKGCESNTRDVNSQSPKRKGLDEGSGKDR